MKYHGVKHDGFHAELGDEPVDEHLFGDEGHGAPRHDETSSLVHRIVRIADEDWNPQRTTQGERVGYATHRKLLPQVSQTRDGPALPRIVGIGSTSSRPGTVPRSQAPHVMNPCTTVASKPRRSFSGANRCGRSRGCTPCREGPSPWGTLRRSACPRRAPRPCRRPTN